jgi:glycosyltransferase involved in cell wall biosynthesis
MNASLAGITPITVILATRNRPALAPRAAASILRSPYPAFHLRIIDQSDDASTRLALQSIADDPRVTIVAAPPRGLAASRNLGVAQSDTPLIAFTDDDCEAAPHWLPAIADAFAADPGIGLMFGTVNAPQYDRGRGFIPAYRVAVAVTAHSLRQKSSIEGFGANMALRRTIWQDLGGFDELMGAGSRFRAGEDTDFTIRALIAGHKVHECPVAVVTHFGFRRWDEAGGTIAGYMIGLGAAHAKMLRLGGLHAWQPVAELAWRWLAARPVADLNHLPPRFARLIGFVQGVWKGLLSPLDCRTGHFGTSARTSLFRARSRDR